MSETTAAEPQPEMISVTMPRHEADSATNAMSRAECIAEAIATICETVSGQTYDAVEGGCYDLATTSHLLDAAHYTLSVVMALAKAQTTCGAVARGTLAGIRAECRRK